MGQEEKRKNRIVRWGALLAVLVFALFSSVFARIAQAQEGLLQVSLHANSPWDGQTTVDVTGAAAGTINYTFYCDRNDNGTNITSDYAAKFDNVSDTKMEWTSNCDTNVSGDHVIKVIVERGSRLVEARDIWTFGSSNLTNTSYLLGFAHDNILPNKVYLWSATDYFGNFKVDFDCNDSSDSTEYIPGRTIRVDKTIVDNGYNTDRQASATCDYSGPGLYTPKVVWKSTNEIFKSEPAHQRVVILEPSGSGVVTPTPQPSPPPTPTLGISLKTNQTTQSDGSVEVNAEANLSGSVIDARDPAVTTNYTVYCDRSDAGTDITPGYKWKYDGVTTHESYDARGATFRRVNFGCQYNKEGLPLDKPGTYTIKVIAERDGAPPVEARAEVVVVDPTLTASISANPTSGVAPLNNVAIKATPGGTAAGTLNYTLYCDRSDDGVNITPDFNKKIDSTSDLAPNFSCDYEKQGTYFPKIIIERDGATPAESRTTVNVTETVLPSPSPTVTVSALPSPSPSPSPSAIPTLFAQVSANPSTGFAPLENVSLTAVATGNSTGALKYTFYCNRSDNGTNITDGSSAIFSNVSETTKTTAPICSYKEAGTYIAKVIIERTGVDPVEARSTIQVNPKPTLSSTLSASPASGTAPLDINLTASAGGTATGSVNYTFYCNRSDDGVDIKSGYESKYDGVNSNSQLAKCSYKNPGTYTAKVVIERDGAPAATAKMNIVARSNVTASLSVDPNGGTEPLKGVILTARAGGNATGPATYAFYCDRADNGTDIAPGYVAKFDSVDAPVSIASCDYEKPGKYKPKVIIQRGDAFPAESRSNVTVTKSDNPLPSPTPSVVVGEIEIEKVGITANPKAVAPGEVIEIRSWVEDRYGNKYDDRGDTAGIKKLDGLELKTELSNSAAGSLTSDSSHTFLETSDKLGTYQVAAVAKYAGSTYREVTNIIISKDVPVLTSVVISLRSSFLKQAVEGQNAFRVKPNGYLGIDVTPLDQFGTVFVGASMKYELTPDVGEYQSSGIISASDKEGTYKDAFKATATSKGRSASSSVDIIIGSTDDYDVCTNPDCAQPTDPDCSPCPELKEKVCKAEPLVCIGRYCILPICKAPNCVAKTVCLGSYCFQSSCMKYLTADDCPKPDCQNSPPSPACKRSGQDQNGCPVYTCPSPTPSLTPSPSSTPSVSASPSTTPSCRLETLECEAPEVQVQSETDSNGCPTYTCKTPSVTPGVSATAENSATPTGGEVGGIGGIGGIGKGISNILASVAGLFSKKDVPASAIGLTAAALSAILMATALAMSAFSPVASVLVQIAKPFNFIFPFAFKHRNNYGVVVDTSSGVGVPRIGVYLTNIDTNRVVLRAVTDKLGRFSLVAPAGNYKLTIPSKNFEIINLAGYYVPGSILAVKEAKKATLAIKIAVSSDKKVLSKKLKLIASLDILQKILVPIAGLVTLWGTYLLFDQMALRSLRSNIIMFSLYTVVWIVWLLSLFSLKLRNYGRIVFSGTKPATTVVRIFDANRRLVTTTVSDKSGRFTIMLPKGKYRLEATAPEAKQSSPVEISIKDAIGPVTAKVKLQKA